MENLPFHTRVHPDGHIICNFTVPISKEATTVTLIYDNDILHEKVFEPNKKEIFAWFSHKFLFAFPGRKIKIMKNYFGHKGKLTTELNYIHPPKCGGSSIEAAGYEHGIRWSRWHEIPHAYHKPSNFFMNRNDLIENKILFTSVRNPYNRLISSLYCPYKLISENRFGKPIDKYEFNRHLSNSISQEYPIYDFVYYKEKKVIPHVLRMEDGLTKQFNKLMKDYNLDIIMTKHTNKGDVYYPYEKFGVEDISNENLKKINEKFYNDFEYFEYDIVKPKPKSYYIPERIPKRYLNQN